MAKINFEELIGRIKDPWEPQDIVLLNETMLRVAKIEGAYHWHTHQNEDELFLVLKGKIFIDTSEESVELNKGEAFLVRKGTRHRSRANVPSWILLIEPERTKTKGD